MSVLLANVRNSRALQKGVERIGKCDIVQTASCAEGVAESVMEAGLCSCSHALLAAWLQPTQSPHFSHLPL